MALTGSTDGSVVLSNLESGWFRRRGGVSHLLSATLTTLTDRE